MEPNERLPENSTTLELCEFYYKQTLNEHEDVRDHMDDDMETACRLHAWEHLTEFLRDEKEGLAQMQLTPSERDLVVNTVSQATMRKPMRKQKPAEQTLFDIDYSKLLAVIDHLRIARMSQNLPTTPSVDIGARSATTSGAVKKATEI